MELSKVASYQTVTTSRFYENLQDTRVSYQQLKYFNKGSKQAKGRRRAFYSSLSCQMIKLMLRTLLAKAFWVIGQLVSTISPSSWSDIFKVDSQMYKLL